MDPLNLKHLENPDKLLDTAFSRARKKASLYPKQKTPFYTLKGKELVRITVFADYLEKRLFDVVKDFPSIDNLSLFYKELMVCVIDVDEMKKNLSSISSVARLIKRLRYSYAQRMAALRFDEKRKVKIIFKEFSGRVSSLLKGLTKKIDFYNDSIRALKEMPAIDTGKESFILAGYPNVGKSTLLKKVTGSKVKTAAYPFTTKELNVGKILKKHIEVQIIDTPGLLDRSLFKRNKVELKAITALQHLKGVVFFIVDPTNDLENQKTLFEELTQVFSTKIVVVINKTDIATEEQVKEAKKQFKGIKKILEGNGKNNLKEFILKETFF